RGVVIAQEFVQADTGHLVSLPGHAVSGVHVRMDEVRKRRQLRLPCLNEEESFSRLLPDATLVDRTLSRAAQLFRAAAGRFGEDAAPCKLLLDHEAVAEIHSVSGPEFDEKAAPFRIKLMQDEEVLKILRPCLARVCEAEVHKTHGFRRKAGFGGVPPRHQ